MPFTGGGGKRGRRAADSSGGGGGRCSGRFSEHLGRILLRSAPPAVPSYSLRKRKAFDYGEVDEPSEEEKEKKEIRWPARGDRRQGDTVPGTQVAAAGLKGRSEGRARGVGGAKAAVPSRSLRSNSLPGGSHPKIKDEEEEEGGGSSDEGQGEDGSQSGGEEEEEEEGEEEMVGFVC